MTSPQNEIALTIVVHEDAHVAIARQKEGWGDAYQKKSAVLRLSKGDLQKLGLKDNARVEITSQAGSVIVAAKSDAACDPGIGLMPSSLYTNMLAGYDPASSTLPIKHIEASAVPTDSAITPISDVKVRRDRA